MGIDCFLSQSQAQKAEKDATELKGTMRKRMEFLDLD
jgi:U6 snRNA-associated Sm-like protein LSm1